MPGRERPILGEDDLHGPYFPDKKWQRQSQRDLWIPTTDDRKKRITWVESERMAPDRIPIDNKPLIASCIDALFIDHDQPGELQPVERIADIMRDTKRQRNGDDEEWLSQSAREAMDGAANEYVRTNKKIAETDLSVQERLFNDLIVAHNGLFVVLEAVGLRKDPNTETLGKAYFAAKLSGVALRLSFTEEAAEFAFEPIVTSHRSGEVGMLPRNDLSIANIFTE